MKKKRSDIVLNNQTKGARVLNLSKIVAVMIMATLLAACASNPKRTNDLYASSVKITNTKANHGGTGIVLRSTPTGSLVLTNSHVCGVVEEGGLVTGRAGQFMVTKYKKSVSHDLCLITVAGDLEANTTIASEPPVLQYEKASISGHPGLMPNVITTGHFSGRDVIPIMIGIKKCTAEDLADEQKAGACIFLGGLPIVKEYESILVTATIMPGSSGSGVYNSKGELAGVAFAGSGQLGYAWTVPYEAVINFLFHEAKTLNYERPTNTVDFFGEGGKDSVETTVLKLKKACSSSDREKIKMLCEIVDRDIVM